MHLSVCITNVAAGKGEDNLNYLIEWINLLSLLGAKLQIPFHDTT